MPDPTQRFSSRAENYSKYRPSYPHDVIKTLQEECRLTPASLVADIGSGTGFLTELFLQNGNQVFAVEPNPDMRASAEHLLQHYPGFHSIAGRAEATTLSDQSVDFVTSGQAFHWFDRNVTRPEFRRILKPDGYLMIVWNERETDATPFLTAYENLLNRYVEDYAQLTHKQVYKTALTDFYGAHGFQSKTFRYRQEFDFEGVKGRLLSSSYTPEAGHPNHMPMLAELSEIFKVHEANGCVEFEYTTRMYYGRLD
jgi:SAM-dependent methyltransferase